MLSHRLYLSFISFLHFIVVVLLLLLPLSFYLLFFFFFLSVHCVYVMYVNRSCD